MTFNASLDISVSNTRKGTSPNHEFRLCTKDYTNGYCKFHFRHRRDITQSTKPNTHRTLNSGFLRLIQTKQLYCVIFALNGGFSTALRPTTNVASFDRLNQMLNPIHNRALYGFEIIERDAPLGQRNSPNCVISYLGFHLTSGAEIFCSSFSLQQQFTYKLSALDVRQITRPGVPRKSVTPPF